MRAADEAVHIGPAPSAESYLRIDRIVDACRKSGAQAVHPGYGFLSENPRFARALTDARITFIGPPPEAMEAMGSKTAAREKMIAAGVPVVPGAQVSSIGEIARAAEKLGYPVMLKAASGGGGKGMRLVERAQDLEAAFERAKSEARTAFGDDTVYVEKAILRPRHVEIQVLADRDGATVHLFERDCSIQRRHQKVIEETPTPAPHAPVGLVDAMGAVAVQAARAVGYFSAGTCEFLLSQTGEFYFLEMNTRLQVEHPITELCTGIDLVHEQVRIAAGEKLGYDQSRVSRRGHAIECRVYAEDPSSGFMPSPGRIERLRVPAGPGVRDDSGVYEGAEVSSFYDPLVSKLSVWAENRPRAIARMRRALSEYVVGGIRTNLPFLARVMEHPDFARGDYDTGFIDRNRPALLDGGDANGASDALAVGAVVATALRDASTSDAAAARASGGSTPGSLSPWRASWLPK